MLQHFEQGGWEGVGVVMGGTSNRLIIIISIYIPHISHGFMAVYNSVRVRSDVSI